MTRGGEKQRFSVISGSRPYDRLEEIGESFHLLQQVLGPSVRGLVTSWHPDASTDVSMWHGKGRLNAQQETPTQQELLLPACLYACCVSHSGIPEAEVGRYPV